RDVEGQLAPSLDLLPAAVAGAQAALLRRVVLVVAPDGERVGTGDRDLQPRLRDRLEERELLVVVRLSQRDGADRGRLGAVLVVEAPDRAAWLEAVRVRDRPRIHLPAELLPVPDPVPARRLLEPDAVTARPARNLVGIGPAPLECLDELLVTLDAD